MKKIECAKKANTPNYSPKYIITLFHLLERHSTGLNELEALCLYGETCLHSTISSLSNGHGIDFKRKRESHKHCGGRNTHFMRYWLADTNKAARLVSPYFKGVLCL
jgi:hypothetical protein